MGFINDDGLIVKSFFNPKEAIMKIRIRLMLSILLVMVTIVGAGECNKLSFNTGVDLVSSYNWRSIDFGNSPAIQPYMTLNYASLEVMAWGSYALIDHLDGSSPYNEIDLVISYEIPTSKGTFSPVLTDYYYPFEGIPYSHYEGVKDDESTGAHWMNIGIDYTGPDQFPIHLMMDYAFHNDPDKPIYFEAGYPMTLDEQELDFFVGFVKGDKKTDLYSVTTDKITMINAGLNIAKTIKISDSFSIPLVGTFSMNPSLSHAFMVFKITLD